MTFTPEQKDKILTELSKKLSRQRAELCFAMIEKGTWKDIGSKVGLTDKTMKWHWGLVTSALKIKSRVELFELMCKACGVGVEHPSVEIVHKLDRCLDSLERIEKSLREVDPFLSRGKFN